jgi:uncharacterized protein YdeI (YjbR/CyaY-like superfamily)
VVRIVDNVSIETARSGEPANRSITSRVPFGAFTERCLLDHPEKFKTRRNASQMTQADLLVMLFDCQDDWAIWLAEHHATSTGIWLRIAKKASQLRSVSYAEALECALCFGWIDGQKKACDEGSWLQKFTPRRSKSIWSKVNREKAEILIQTGRMKPAGLKEVERARDDGRWAAAYDSVSKAEVPPDLQAELDGNAKAKAFFATLNSRNRYAILFRIQTAKKAETRARRVKQFVAMLERGELIHP